MKSRSLISTLAMSVAIVFTPALAAGASAPVSDRAVMKTTQQQIEKDAAVVNNNRMSKCVGRNGDDKKECEKQAKADAKIVKHKEQSEQLKQGGKSAAKP